MHSSTYPYEPNKSRFDITYVDYRKLPSLIIKVTAFSKDDPN